jgi:hypothetical protein
MVIVKVDTVHNVYFVLSFRSTTMVGYLTRGCWRFRIQVGLNLGNSPYNCVQDDMVIKKNDMGRACSMCGEEERCIQDLGGDT